MYISVPSSTSVKQVGELAGGQAARGNASLTAGRLSQKTIYQDLNDAQQVHAWLRATVTAFGRSIIGPGMVIARDAHYGDEGTDEERDLLYDFYNGIDGRDFKNISDWYPFSAKLYRTAGQFRLFGFAAWELRRNGFDEVVSYDVVPGFVWPNCEEDGTFKDPPFMQYLGASKVVPIELDPDDIVFFMNPDFGTRLFTTDFEALSEYVLPTDIYLSLAMRSLLENWRTPMGFVSLDEHAMQEDVDNLTRRLDVLYRGAANYGKSAVVVRGDVEFKTLAPPVSDLPFRDGHNVMKDEVEGISGVHGGKLGRTEELSRSNLREIRRDYWETTHLPTVKLLADQMYVLIHQRVFGIRAWRPVFKSPDFLNQVEKATVGMRGRQWGALNTNEFRAFVYDYPPIDEEWANTDYLMPTNMATRGDSPAPEGEEPVGEPNTDSEPPVRGDTNNTEDIRSLAINEMRAYARFRLKRVGKQNLRPFKFEYVPDEIVDMVNDALDTYGNTKDNVKMIFDAVISGMEA